MKNLGFIGLVLAVLLQLSAAEDIFHSSLLHGKARNMANGMAEGKYTPEEEMDTSFWVQQAQTDLLKRIRQKTNNNKAKNIIFFLGDGMSIATLTAARIMKGQRLGKTGEESRLTLEDFPYAGLSKTYCTNGQTPDSSCTATAYLCGVKTNMMMTGVNAHVNFNNCSASADVKNHLESIATWAQRAGKATGIVTTTTVTHASPSGSYAHVANRMWESDADIVASNADPSEGCVDIATQLVTQQPGTNFDVILGGGTRHFLPRSAVDTFGNNGSRLDGVDLIAQWQLQNPAAAVVHTRDELLQLDYKAHSRVMGLFNTGDLEFNLDAAEKRPTQPRLKDMTEAAIRMLQKNKKGFFVFIEGGRIDHGHHYTKAGYALDETLELNEAIAAALAMTNSKDTLVVLTSDHAHTMSIAGYPGRGNPILGINANDVDVDGTPYNTLNYAVGIEQYLDANGKRKDLTGLLNDDSFTPSYIKGIMGTHSGEDVGVFASGPHAHLFSGVMQQNLIPHIMAYAADMGPGAKCASKCSNKGNKPK